MICRLCRQELDTEHPDSVHGVNPKTFRMAWMHWDCFMDEYQQTEYEKPKNETDYMSRQDEYRDFIQLFPE